MSRPLIKKKGSGLLLTLICRILFLMISVVHFDEHHAFYHIMSLIFNSYKVTVA